MGPHGSGPGQFNLPLGIAVDLSGNVYVAEPENCRIEKFGSVTIMSVEQVVLIIAIVVIVGSMGAYLIMRKRPKKLRRRIAPT